MSCSDEILAEGANLLAWWRMRETSGAPQGSPGVTQARIEAHYDAAFAPAAETQSFYVTR